MVSTVGTSTGAQGTQFASKTNKLALKADDFIKMMVTQLQQQDPMDPAKNDQLLAQMSQISQLQSTTSLTDSLKGMVQQNQIGAAAALIGKSVQGMDAQNLPITGQVTSVRVAGDEVNLELDNGQQLSMTRVTSIGAGTAATTPTPTPAS
jgi:flagellar basal-body rod modification protein FlgD